MIVRCGSETADSRPLARNEGLMRYIPKTEIFGTQQYLVNLECPRIMSTDLDGLTCKIMAETHLMHEPPDHCAPGEAPEDQDDGGPYPTLRALLVSRYGSLSESFEHERRNQPDS